MKVTALCIMSWICIAAGMASAQKFEATGLIGGQINGGVDLSTTVYKRFEVRNGLTYGLGLGYLPTERSEIEFMWTYNKADTTGQPRSGAASTKLFTLDSNKYFANFLYHFSGPETKLRPFFLAGLGASNLSPAVAGVHSTTRFAFAVGAGAKYNLTPHVGLRFQGRYSPTYLTTTNAGFWCDPIWGGCWVVGHSHFLNAIDGTAGLVFRF